MSRVECPVKGCARLRRGEMCKPHWMRVPADLRSEVWATWKAWRADFGDIDRMHAYRAASEAALASVEGGDW